MDRTARVTADGGVRRGYRPALRVQHGGLRATSGEVAAVAVSVLAVTAAETLATLTTPTSTSSVVTEVRDGDHPA